MRGLQSQQTRRKPGQQTLPFINRSLGINRHQKIIRHQTLLQGHEESDIIAIPSDIRGHYQLFRHQRLSPTHAISNIITRPSGIRCYHPTIGHQMLSPDHHISVVMTRHRLSYTLAYTYLDWSTHRRFLYCIKLRMNKRIVNI